MTPLSSLLNLFNAPPRDEMTFREKLIQIAQIVAAIVAVSVVTAALGTITIKLAVG